MSPRSPEASSTDLHADIRRIEGASLSVRVRARLRGIQTLRQARKLGLRAQPPLRLAARTIIDPDFAWAVEIGPYTILANDVRIIAHDAATKRLTGYTEVRPVTIGARCYIGAGAIVLPGSVIGDDTIVGAGALVRGEIPPRSLAVGNPARVIGSVDDLRARHLEQMASSPTFELRPDDLSAPDIERLRRALAEHGRVYLL
jgi:maltose O-acetyltransferase